jgi:hypothetical protein
MTRIKTRNCLLTCEFSSGNVNVRLLLFSTAPAVLPDFPCKVAVVWVFLRELISVEVSAGEGALFSPWDSISTVFELAFDLTG